ncbi:MAG: hypothetical protein WBF06_07335 [Candidatus Acidiferrales bacterium]
MKHIRQTNRAAWNRVELFAHAVGAVERWTKVNGSELSLYYALSIWNAYVVVLMKSRLKVE